MHFKMYRNITSMPLYTENKIRMQFLFRASKNLESEYSKCVALEF